MSQGRKGGMAVLAIAVISSLTQRLKLTDLYLEAINMLNFRVYCFSAVMVFLLLVRSCYAAPGAVFYFEDFSSVKEGNLPANWSGGEKLMVKEYRGKKFLTSFENIGGEHSVVVNGVRFPQNYEFEIIATMHEPHSPYPPYCLMCRIGNIQAGAKSYYGHYALLNESKEKTEKYDGKTVKIIIRREGPVVKLLIDGQDILMGRYPEQKDPVTTFTLSLGNGDIIHSIKGTEL